MKKISLLLLCAAMVMTASAAELWSGSKHVSWAEGGLHLGADLFAEAQPGQKIVVSFTDASDGIEFKVLNENFDHLAGSREAAWISGDGTFDQYLIAAGIDSLQAHGLEIIGANINITKVELLEGKELKDGITVWTGLFWADQWSTLELYRDGYCNVDFSNIAAIRFYSEAAGTDYVLNFLEHWDEGGKFADKGAMTDGEGYAELALDDNLRARLAAAGHWMIQFNKEGLEPFNVTDVVLVLGEQTALEDVQTTSVATKRIVNGQVIIEHDGVRFNTLGTQL